MEPILSTGAPAPSLPLALDHLVVAAATLDEGEAWLQQRLGPSPIDPLGRPGAQASGMEGLSGMGGLMPGGSHPGYGTHNRLLRLGSAHYLELIAPDPAQAGAHRRGGTTLFGLDQPAMTAALAGGPRLMHLVLRVTQPGSLASLLPRLRYDPGPIVRMTRGDLAWDLTLARGGRLAGDGLLPTLIDWGSAPHPCTRLPESGIVLESIRIQGPEFVVAAFPEPATGADHARITLAAAPTAEISAGFRIGERRIIIQSALSIRELAR